jgi:long-subunit fatty acid transport protein
MTDRTSTARQTARAATLVAALLVALVVPRAARAGGMEVGDNGAVAMARGGAFVAKADNPAAVNYNPAGFAKLRGTQFAISLNAVRSKASFRRLGRYDLGSGDTPFFPEVSTKNPWFAAPMHMMVTTDFGIFDRVTFAAGFFAPSAAPSGFAAEVNVGGRTLPAPQRYDAVEMSGLIAFPTAGMAIRVLPWLDIGVTFQAVVTKVATQNYANVGSACERSEDPLCDVVIKIDAEDMFSPSGSIGFLARPWGNFEFGGQLRLPSKAELKGEASLQFGPNVQKLAGSMRYPLIEPEKPSVTLNNQYPWMGRLGARYIFRRGEEEVGDIELDFVWENWSAVSVREINMNAKSLNKPMETQIMDSGYKDTYALKLGGHYRFALGANADLTLRFGAFFETETTAVSDTTLGSASAKRIGLCSGLGLRWGRYSLDMAYAHVFFPDRAVGQSSKRVMDFGSPDPSTGAVVGNGTYRNSTDMFSLQLTIAFGRGVKAARTVAAAPRRSGEAEAGRPARRRSRPRRLLDDDYGFRVQGAAQRKDGKRVGVARAAAADNNNNLMFDPEDIRLPAAAQRPAPAPAPAHTPAPRAQQDEDEAGEHPRATRQQQRRSLRQARAAKRARYRAARRAKRIKRLKRLRRIKRLRRARRARRARAKRARRRRATTSGSCARYNAWGRCVRRR